jgi:hypothetical protein
VNGMLGFTVEYDTLGFDIWHLLEREETKRVGKESTGHLSLHGSS